MNTHSIKKALLVIRIDSPVQWEILIEKSVRQMIFYAERTRRFSVIKTIVSSLEKKRSSIPLEASHSDMSRVVSVSNHMKKVHSLPRIDFSSFTYSLIEDCPLVDCIWRPSPGCRIRCECVRSRWLPAECYRDCGCCCCYRRRRWSMLEQEAIETWSFIE